MTGPRPPHLQPRLLALVFLGGAAGTLARWSVGLAVPHVDRVPAGTVVVNVVGAFVLGALLEHLARRGPDVGGRRVLRLTVGTGFCGGFTTYSSLATATAVLLADGDAVTGALYAAATLLIGGLASWAGIVCGALVGGRR